MKKVLFSLVLAATAASLSASPVDMMIGARGYGFGGAYGALADEPSAAYWNPSRLSYVDHVSVLASNWILQDVEGMNVNYVSVAIPLKFVGTLSGSWLLNHATLEYGKEDASGNLMMVENTASENVFSLSLGRALFDELLFLTKPSIGFSINRYAFNTDEDNGAGLGFDVALSTEFPMGFSLGFTARTLGAEVMGYKVDPELRLGLGYSNTFNDMHRVTVGLDGVHKMNRDYTDENTLEPARSNVKTFGGLEYAILMGDLEAAVRGGANAMVLHSTSKNYNFSAGAGFKYLGYALQYAFMGSTDRDLALGYGHRISLCVQLDKLYPGQEDFGGSGEE